MNSDLSKIEKRYKLAVPADVHGRRSAVEVANAASYLCWSPAGAYRSFARLLPGRQEDRRSETYRSRHRRKHSSGNDARLLPNPFEKYGIKFVATYIGETLGNVSGGLRQGAIYEGRLNLAADVDLQKLLGDLTFHANMFQIHGNGLSRGYLQNFLVASGIEALSSARLYEMWFERKWGTTLALRAGQLAANTEFMNAKYTDVFTNASLGWPAITSINLPSGGPSPPLAALGTRVRANLSDNWTVVAAVFDGDAAGPGPKDPQLRDNHGVNFRINDPPLVLGEVQYVWNGKKGDPGLEGKLKIGGWRHFGEFADQRFNAQGASLALGAGAAATFWGDHGIYSVFEQKVYRVGKDDDRGIGVFARISSSPSDRN